MAIDEMRPVLRAVTHVVFSTTVETGDEDYTSRDSEVNCADSLTSISYC
jgi:hypothetical protein